MAKKKKKRKKKGKGGVIVVLICGVAAAGYFLRDCIPGFGVGGGAGDGTESSESDSDNPDTEPKPGEKGTVAVVVKGETCEAGGDATPCMDLCTSIKGEHTPEESQVEVDGTNGATETVEAFRGCLADAGYTVNVKSE